MPEELLSLLASLNDRLDILAETFSTFFEKQNRVQNRRLALLAEAVDDAND